MRRGLIQKIQTRERLVPEGEGNLKIITLKLTGKEEKYCITAEERELKDGGWFNDATPVWTSTLQELMFVTRPSKEEIAAEESVAKAKEALKAAENALKAVKEKK